MQFLWTHAQACACAATRSGAQSACTPDIWQHARKSVACAIAPQPRLKRVAFHFATCAAKLPRELLRARAGGDAHHGRGGPARPAAAAFPLLVTSALAQAVARSETDCNENARAFSAEPLLTAPPASSSHHQNPERNGVSRGCAAARARRAPAGARERERWRLPHRVRGPRPPRRRRQGVPHSMRFFRVLCVLLHPNGPDAATAAACAHQACRQECSGVGIQG